MIRYYKFYKIFEDDSYFFKFKDNILKSSVSNILDVQLNVNILRILSRKGVSWLLIVFFSYEFYNLSRC